MNLRPPSRFYHLSSNILAEDIDMRADKSVYRKVALAQAQTLSNLRSASSCESLETLAALLFLPRN